MDNKKRKRLFAILSELGMGSSEDRHTLILEFTQGRTSSSSDLSQWEADLLIQSLESKEYQAADKMRKKIISMAIEMGWSVVKGGKLTGDMAAIHTWCINRSYGKKALNAYTYNELPKLVTQFESMYKSHLKGK